MNKPIYIATRGSALALAQANQVLLDCRARFPQFAFELRIIKTTGDKLQTAAVASDAKLPRGLFTKELEAALLKGVVDIAVHSLKDLPVDLPEGLQFAAVAGKRQDVRDVLICRDAAFLKSIGDTDRRGFQPGVTLRELPAGLTIATGSNRRAAQLRALRPDFKTVPLRGNVSTRMEKLMAQPGLDGTLLAAAGLARLKFQITRGGKIKGPDAPEGFLALFIEPEEMLPCAGQAAIGLEIRAGDSHMEEICRSLNDDPTYACVQAERSLLRAMGGGCQTPIGVYADITGGKLRLRAVSFLDGQVRRAESTAPVSQAVQLGIDTAKTLRGITV